jgi:hypothetical protein
MQNVRITANTADNTIVVYSNQECLLMAKKAAYSRAFCHQSADENDLVLRF